MLAANSIERPLSGLRSLLFACLCWLHWPAEANYCMQQWACVEVVRQAQQIDFYLRNRTPYPFTGTLKIASSNLRHQHSDQNEYDFTRVVAGHQRLHLATLTVSNQDQSHWFDEQLYWTPGDMHATHNDDYRYAKPYAPGSKFRIVQGFGGGYSHRGASRYALDFAMPVGTPVHAAREGLVIDLQQNNTLGGASRRYAKYANFVTILHDDGTTGEYYHLQHKGVVVKVGEQVAKGQHIGYSGNTGFSSLPHLHFAVYRAKSHGGYESLPFKFSP